MCCDSPNFGVGVFTQRIVSEHVSRSLVPSASGLALWFRCDACSTRASAGLKLMAPQLLIQTPVSHNSAISSFWMPSASKQTPFSCEKSIQLHKVQASDMVCSRCSCWPLPLGSSMTPTCLLTHQINLWYKIPAKPLLTHNLEPPLSALEGLSQELIQQQAIFF